MPIHHTNSKCMLGRFMDVVRRIKQDLQAYHQSEFWYTHCCLEMGMLSSQSVVKLVIKDDPAAASSTNSKTDSPEEAAIRKAMANQMVMGKLAFSVIDAHRNDKMIVATHDVHSYWHTM